MKQILRGARLLDPGQGLDQQADLWLHEGQITQIGNAGNAAADGYHEIDGSGRWLLPAGVDLQADLTRHTDTELAAAGAGGVALVGCAPSPDNCLDSPALVEHLLREAAAGSSVIAPIGALTRNLAGQQLTDYAALQAAGCVALSNGNQPLADSAVLRNALKYAASLNLPVFLHPNDPSLAGGCVHEGPIATRLGLPAVPAVAESAGLARDLELVADTGAQVHFTRLSCARSVQLLETAISQGLPVTADVSVAHLFLTDHDVSGFNPLCHVMPPLRSTVDRKALLDGVNRGIIAAICSDHRPLSADAKLAPFAATEPGISGLETLLALGMRLVDDGALTMDRMLHAVTSAPAQILGCKQWGLEVGSRTARVLWNPAYLWQPVRDNWLSHGTNSPFSSWELKGRAETVL